MDPLTHTALGAAIGYATGGRRLGRQAAWIGAVAGAMADADVLIRSSSNPLLAIQFHRHFTHSLVFSLAGSLAVAAAWFMRQPWRAEWRTIWGCAFLAWVSHCLLDASTSYGTVLRWPFTEQRIGWNLISIIDPVFTGVLITGLIAARWRHSQIPVRIALAVVTVYLATGGVQHARASRAQNQLASSRGHQPERALAMPTLGNNLVWRSLYLHEGRIYTDRIRVGWSSGVSCLEGASVRFTSLSDLTVAERDRNAGTRAMERLIWFADGWVARADLDPGLLGDVRYSQSPEAFKPIWGVRFTPAGEELPYRWESHSRDRKLNLAELWSEITGTHPGYHPIRLHGR